MFEWLESNDDNWKLLNIMLFCNKVLTKLYVLPKNEPTEAERAVLWDAVRWFECGRKICQITERLEVSTESRKTSEVWSFAFRAINQIPYRASVYEFARLITQKGCAGTLVDPEFDDWYHIALQISARPDLIPTADLEKLRNIIKLFRAYALKEMEHPIECVTISA